MAGRAGTSLFVPEFSALTVNIRHSSPKKSAMRGSWAASNVILGHPLARSGILFDSLHLI